MPTSVSRPPPPKVTVVIPAYNRADHIAETLESVRRQTFADWECVVVDDCSTDATPDIAAGFARRDRRFRLERMPRNSDVSAARNHGIACARGEYVAFLDSDDLFAPDKLAWQVAALEADPGAVLAYGEALHFQGEDPAVGTIYLERVDPKPHGDAFEQLLCCSAIYAPVVRRSALLRTGGFDADLPSAEDWDAWLKVSRLGRVVHERRVALHYRAHAGSKSTATLESFECSGLVARRHLRAVPRRRRPLLALRIWRYFADTTFPERLRRAADEFDAAGDWRSARRAWRAAAALRPGGLRGLRHWALAAWALLPTGHPPIWRHAMGRRAHTSTRPPR